MCTQNRPSLREQMNGDPRGDGPKKHPRQGAFGRGGSRETRAGCARRRCVWWGREERLLHPPGRQTQCPTPQPPTGRIGNLHLIPSWGITRSKACIHVGLLTSSPLGWDEDSCSLGRGDGQQVRSHTLAAPGRGYHTQAPREAMAGTRPVAAELGGGLAVRPWRPSRFTRCRGCTPGGS